MTGAMTSLKPIFGVDKPLIAMCHLQALPGRPRHDRAGGIDHIVDLVRRDLEALQAGGVDAVMFCNEHDLPYSTHVGVEAAAAMAAVVARLRPDITVPYGVNLLWDPKATLAVARAVGASFVREIFTGVYESDMGLVAPDYGELAAYRTAIGADDVAILANITPEFSGSIGGRSVGQRAASTAYMGVEALLISGAAAGVGAAMDDLREAKAAAPGTPVLANTGVRHDTVEAVLEVADGAVVGTSLKVDGNTWNPVDPERVVTMMERVAAVREGR
jgi:membrane complex biogenesis BtpA family protein